MAVWETILPTVGGALSATVGVLVGAVLTRRTQDRHWLRDKQLVAYQELLRQYAGFAMILRRAHLGRTGWNYDWAAWSAALTAASLVAPVAVADEIDKFGRAIDTLLKQVAVDTTARSMMARSRLVLTRVSTSRSYDPARTEIIPHEPPSCRRDACTVGRNGWPIPDA